MSVHRGGALSPGLVHGGIGHSRVGADLLASFRCGGSLSFKSHLVVLGERLDLSVCQKLAGSSTCRGLGRSTGRLQLLARDAQNLVRGALHQLQHRVYSALIASIDGQQNTLNGLALVGVGLRTLFPAVGSQSQKLRNKEEIPTLSLVKVSLSFSHGIRPGLLNSLPQFRLVCRRPRFVLLCDLEVLGQLLFGLGELGLQGRFLEDLGLLIGIDDAAGDKLVEGLARGFLEDGVRLGCVGLGKCQCRLTKPRENPANSEGKAGRLTIFLLMLRMFLSCRVSGSFLRKDLRSEAVDTFGAP